MAIDELINNFHEHFVATVEEKLSQVKDFKFPEKWGKSFREDYFKMEGYARKQAFGESQSQRFEGKDKALFDALTNLNKALKQDGDYPDYDALLTKIGQQRFTELMTGVKNAYSKNIPANNINQNYGAVVTSITGAINGISFEIFPMEDEKHKTKLSDAYTIEAVLGYKNGKGKYAPLGQKVDLTEAFSQGNPRANLGFGRTAGSAFASWKDKIEADNDTVSRHHLYLEETKDGLVINDTSCGGTIAVDYEGNEHILHRNYDPKEDKKVKLERPPLSCIVVPVDDFDGKAVRVTAYFGGKDMRQYRIDIGLTKKKAA